MGKAGVSCLTRDAGIGGLREARIGGLTGERFGKIWGPGSE